MTTARLTLVISALLLATACSTTPDQEALDSRPAEVIFDQAETQAASGDFAAAAASFDDVERLHPYSQLAKTAMLRSAQSYYLAGDPAQARLAAERFLNFYPADPDAAQAQFIIASTWYDEIVDVGRDQRATREAQTALRETVARYPDSEFARLAQLKLDLTMDQLAGTEMDVGRYYLKRDQHVAAINRFRSVIEQYDTTSHAPEALHRLVESYLALGVVSEAETAAAVLGYNFPGSSWYASSYDLLTGANTAPRLNSNSWLASIYRQVVLGDWL
jgi:outer membrane protein assembly factor BamD